jgi:hypothetical protein
MNIFRSVNNKIEKPAYDISIKNINISGEHWGSEKMIISFLEEIEGMLYNKEDFQKNMVLHTLYLYNNPRTKNLVFYTIPEENKVILLSTNEIRAFKEDEFLSREISIVFKKQKFAFSIIEIIEKEEKEITEGKKTIPTNWVFDEYMNARINKLKHYNF